MAKEKTYRITKTFSRYSKKCGCTEKTIILKKDLDKDQVQEYIVNNPQLKFEKTGNGSLRAYTKGLLYPGRIIIK